MRESVNQNVGLHMHDLITSSKQDVGGVEFGCYGRIGKLLDLKTATNLANGST